MPKIFETDGFSFFFYMNEHEPVHVHVRKQGKIAKFEIVNGSAVPVFGKLSNADMVRLYGYIFVHLQFYGTRLRLGT